LLEILLDNRDGVIWDISELVSSVSWQTTRIGKPSKLSLTLIKDTDKKLKVETGAVIRVKADDKGIFYGYVFTKEQSQKDEITLTAYDQIRYLQANDTYVFTGATATDIIKRIASGFELKAGTLEDTRYKIPSMVEDNQKLLDIVYKALDLTLINTGQIYVFYDDFGSLMLKNAKNMALNIIIGDESLLYEYSYKRSIDDDVYNRVKLVKNNKDTGKRDVYIAQDSANMAKWGRLQLYQTVDEGLNEAQIKEQLDRLIQLKNREQIKFNLTALGDTSVRAGCYIPIFLSELSIGKYFLVEECTHKWEGKLYTMSLEVKVV
jgi:hypothetical protein